MYIVYSFRLTMVRGGSPCHRGLTVEVKKWIIKGDLYEPMSQLSGRYQMAIYSFCVK